MPIRRCIGPEVRQIYSLRIHLVSVTTVIPDFLSTMPAFFYGKSDLVEHTRGASCEIEKCIVSRIQLLSSWIRTFHRQCYPMSELQFFSHNWGKANCKFRGSIEKKGTSGFQYTATFKNPYSAPAQIFISCHVVVIAILVVLSQVEWRIRKHSVDHFRFHVPKDVNAVCVIEDPMRRGQEWLLQLTGSKRITLFVWWEAPGNGIRGIVVRTMTPLCFNCIGSGSRSSNIGQSAILRTRGSVISWTRMRHEARDLHGPGGRSM